MVQIIERLTIGIRPQFSKDLDMALQKLCITPTITDFYETEVMERSICRYYVQVICNEEEKQRLIDYLKNDFEHDVTISI